MTKSCILQKYGHKCGIRQAKIKSERHLKPFGKRAQKGGKLFNCVLNSSVCGPAITLKMSAEDRRVQVNLDLPSGTRAHVPRQRGIWTSLFCHSRR